MPALASGVLARGPWLPDQVAVTWREDPYVAPAADSARADQAIAELAERGSPSHDGLAARLADWAVTPGGGIALELQPMRWGLRLGSNAAGAFSALCVIRSADGRWLAGRRASWVASWAGRWALGAGGAVELGEGPVETLRREVEEEWSVAPARLSIEALVSLPNGMAMLIGLAQLAAEATVQPDSEHDEFAWWPADVDCWPPEADPVLRDTARLLTSA